MIEEIARGIASFVFGTIFDGLIHWLRHNSARADTILFVVTFILLGFVL